jgi:thiol-disulfide isomerase/thioredoxin
MGDNRRKSYRLPPSESSEKVALRHDGVDYAATVVNLSAEGFRLSCDVDPDKSPSVTVGDVVLLATGNGRHEVRVANVNRANGSLQLGVIRLRDFRDPPARTRRESNDAANFSGRRGGPSMASPLVQFVVLAFVVALILVAYNVLFIFGSKTDMPSPAQARRTAPGRQTAVPAWRPTQAPPEAVSRKGQRLRSNPTLPFVEGRTIEPGTSNRSATPSGDVVLPQGSGPATEEGAKQPETSADRSSAGNQGVEASAAGITGDNGGSRQVSPFDAKSDGSTRVVAALKRAARENKHVLVEFGTEKCDSCYRLHNLLTTNAEISAALKAFVLVSVDSHANQALATRFTQDGRPLDPPVLTLLDQDGKVLSSQRLSEIEAGRKPDVEKIKAFLRQSAASK